MIPHVEKMPVKYVFTDEELVAKAREQARLFDEKNLAEDEKKQIADQIKARISGLEAGLSALTSQLRSGFEMRTASVMTLRYRPDGGHKTLVRLDTGLVMSTVALTRDERQMELVDEQYSHVAELVREDHSESVRLALYEAEAKQLEGLNVFVLRIDEVRQIDTEASAD